MKWPHHDNLRILLYLMENEMATSWWWCDGRKDETKMSRSNPNPEEKSVDKSIKLSRKLCKTQIKGRRGAPPLGEEVRCKIAGEWAYELGGVTPTKLAPLQHAGIQTPIAMPRPPSSINKSINPLSLASCFRSSRHDEYILAASSSAPLTTF